ncbi:MAG TPA: MFS transporter, partial [Acidimicrobiia bacterium]
MTRDRNLTLVAAARFVSRGGGEAAFFVGLWGKAAFEFDSNPSELALLMATLSISVLIGSALAGVLVDRFDPRRVLMAGEVLFVPATLSILLADNMGELTIFAALLGFFQAPVFTAITSFAPYLTADPGQLERINSRLEAAGMAAFVVGPATGALVVIYATVDWIFVLDALTSLIAVALVAFVAVRPLEHAERHGALRELRDGFRFSYRSRQLRFYILVGTALWLAFGAFGALEPLFYRDVLGVGMEALGWVNTIFGIGLVAGSLLLPRLPGGLRSAKGVVLFFGLNALGILLYVGTGNVPVVVVGAIVWGMLIGVMFPLVRTLIHLNSPEPLIGRISGVVQVHSTAAELVPLAIAPALATAWGVQQTLVATGVAVLAVALLARREA